MQSLLPLERRLQLVASTNSDNFPDQSANYWDRYQALVGYLRTQIYPQINAGLACLSRSPGIYTDHGANHFDEVVRYAGLLVEPTFTPDGKGTLEPYELYLLLSAIRLHDAGNIDGRERHEKRALHLLTAAGHAVCPDTFEVDLIGRIAEAHGGKNESGDKDTIGQLQATTSMGPVPCRPQLVASLVRFADEICEHSMRASSHHLQTGTLPAGNHLFHLYAKAIKEAFLSRSDLSFRLHLVFEATDLDKFFETPMKEQRYLLDDALDRIAKLDAERIYCNRFLLPQLRTDRLDVTVDVMRSNTVDGKPISIRWMDHRFSIRDMGYPKPDTKWRAPVQKKIGGAAVAKKLQKSIGQAA